MRPKIENFLLVANGEPPSSTLLNALIPKHQALVAVDGGLHCCLSYGLIPQLLIGDFDSVSSEVRAELSDVSQIHAFDQSKSDLEKAIEYLFSQGAHEITVCGALGKRIDHTLTNICLLCRYPGKVKFETDAESCFALPPMSHLQCHEGQIVSLIPISTSVTHVFTKGLKWELSGETLSKKFLSISNVCVEPNVTIQFHSGDLVACLMKASHV